MIEKQFDAGGLRLRYLEAGAGDPILMLHGGEGLAWSALHEALARSARVIAPEIPYTAGGACATMRELARTLDAFAAGLGLERCRIVSFGLSARAALWLAIDAAERVAALAMVAPAAILPENWVAPAAMPEAHRALTRPRRDAELESHFGAIEAPVLIVFGTRDTLVPPAMGRLYRERIADSYYVMVYDAGHAIAAERPDALVSVVGDFLERGDAFIVNRESGLLNP